MQNRRNTSYMSGNTRTKEAFFQKVFRKSDSEKSVTRAKMGFIHIENFCQSTFKENHDVVISKLKKQIKKDPNDLYIFLDDFLAYLSTVKKPNLKTRQRTGEVLAPATIISIYHILKSYLRYQLITIDNNTEKQFVTLPKIKSDLEKPITLEEIQLLISKSDIQRTALYLVLASSGMRLGEALQLKKNNFDLTSEITHVIIPARIVKNSHGRTTYISNEATEKLRPILEKLDHDDLVFTTSDNSEQAGRTEQRYFSRLRIKCGLTQRETNGRKSHIRMHKFRGRFASICTSAGMQTEHVEAIIGWTSFKRAYYKDDIPVLESYSKIQPHLLISPEWRSLNEIQEKDKQLSRIKELDKRVSELEDQKDDLEDKLVTSLARHIPKIPPRDLSIIDIAQYNQMMEVGNRDERLNLPSKEIVIRLIEFLNEQKKWRKSIKLGMKEGRLTKSVWIQNEELIKSITQTLKKIN